MQLILGIFVYKNQVSMFMTILGRILKETILNSFIYYILIQYHIP